MSIFDTKVLNSPEDFRLTTSLYILDLIYSLVAILPFILKAKGFFMFDM